LQPEIEINEYSSSKKNTLVIYYSSTDGVPTRLLAAALEGREFQSVDAAIWNKRELKDRNVQRLNWQMRVIASYSQELED